MYRYLCTRVSSSFGVKLPRADALSSEKSLLGHSYTENFEQIMIIHSNFSFTSRYIFPLSGYTC